jgi:hypothetical protein
MFFSAWKKTLAGYRPLVPSRTRAELLLAPPLLLLIGGISMAAGAPSQKHDFAPGQVWTFHLDPGEPAATLTILKVETLEKLGDVVHISVSAVRVPGGVTGIGHLPMSRSALDRSVVKLVGTEDRPPDLGGYETWKSAKGGVFTTSVSEAMNFVRQAIERQ